MMTQTSRFLFRHEAVLDDDRVVRRIVESTGFFSAAEVDVAVELVDDRLAKEDASDYSFLFAESSGQTVGYACWGSIACTVGSYDLYWIAVDSTHQRQGLGCSLLEEVERRIEQQAGRHIYIETSNRPQYTPTRAFYLRCGYEIAAVLKDFYDFDDDKVILRKVLDTPARSCSRASSA